MRRDIRRYHRRRTLFRAGVYLATRPRYSTTVVVTGTTYYYAGGVYYVNRGGRYVVVNPPPGAVVYAVPTTTTVVYVGETPYYYDGGTYYIATDKAAVKPDPTEITVNVNVSTGEDGEDDDFQTLTSKISTEDGEEVELPPMPVDDPAGRRDGALPARERARGDRRGQRVHGLRGNVLPAVRERGGDHLHGRRRSPRDRPVR